LPEKEEFKCLPEFTQQVLLCANTAIDLPRGIPRVEDACDIGFQKLGMMQEKIFPDGFQADAIRVEP
jgi:hypothetical protein